MLLMNDRAPLFLGVSASRFLPVMEAVGGDAILCSGSVTRGRVYMRRLLRFGLITLCSSASWQKLW